MCVCVCVCLCVCVGACLRACVRECAHGFVHACCVCLHFKEICFACAANLIQLGYKELEVGHISQVEQQQ